MKKFKTGFTLIELLVVIAIIAILAAILFPVFAKVREKARQTTCLSNEKQIALAVLQYNQDFDECYPLMYAKEKVFPGDPGYAGADEILNPYIKNGTGGSDGNGDMVGGVWACPSFPVKQSDNYHFREDLFTPDWELNKGSSIGNLAMVDAPASKALGWESGQMGTGLSGNGIQFNTDPWAGWEDYTQGGSDLAGGISDDDCPKGGFNGNCGGGWPPGGGMFPRYRHNGVCNMMWLDGHAKAEHRGQFQYCRDLFIGRSDENMPCAAAGTCYACPAGSY